MPFPDSPRVRYGKPVLYEVTSQIRFPTILKIGTSQPADFQDTIRERFPYYTQEAPQAGSSPTTSVPGPTFTFNLNAPAGLVHVFTSADRLWGYKLAGHELMIFTRQYRSWEAYRERVAEAFAALERVYKPGFYTHVCVRYRNAVPNWDEQKRPVGWAELLNPLVLGPLADDRLGTEIKHLQNRFSVEIPGAAGKMDATVALGSYSNTGTPAVLIENHAYADGQIRGEHVLEKLDAFHDYSRLFFRWCVTDRLHTIMDPAPCG